MEGNSNYYLFLCVENPVVLKIQSDKFSVHTYLIINLYEWKQRNFSSTKKTFQPSGTTSLLT
jgi:hypothetical protein